MKFKVRVFLVIATVITISLSACTPTAQPTTTATQSTTQAVVTAAPTAVPDSALLTAAGAQESEVIANCLLQESPELRLLVIKKTASWRQLWTAMVLEKTDAWKQTGKSADLGLADYPSVYRARTHNLYVAYTASGANKYLEVFLDWHVNTCRVFAACTDGKEYGTNCIVKGDFPLTPSIYLAQYPTAVTLYNTRQVDSAGIQQENWAEKLADKAAIENLYYPVMTSDIPRTWASGQPYTVLDANADQTADLNGDGNNDTFRYTPIDDYEAKLTVNGTTIQLYGTMLYKDKFFLADINTTDKYKELIVQEVGESDDYALSFFRYDGTQISYMRTIGGILAPLTTAHGSSATWFDGKGGVLTSERGNILYTFFYRQKYVLDAQNRLCRVDDTYYDINCSVTVKVDLSLRDTPAGQKNKELKAGQKATLIKMDNCQWVLIKGNNGVQGWFRVKPFSFINMGEDFMPSFDVFDGLVLAD